jgi:hypothetical protein
MYVLFRCKICSKVCLRTVLYWSGILLFTLKSSYEYIWSVSYGAIQVLLFGLAWEILMDLVMRDNTESISNELEGTHTFIVLTSRGKYCFDY